MLSVKLIAASINGTVSDLKKALSSGSTLNHKNLIKVSHLYHVNVAKLQVQIYARTYVETKHRWSMSL